MDRARHRRAGRARRIAFRPDLDALPRHALAAGQRDFQPAAAERPAPHRRNDPLAADDFPAFGAPPLADDQFAARTCAGWRKAARSSAARRFRWRRSPPRRSKKPSRWRKARASSCRCNIPLTLPTVEADSDMIRRVISNLLDNAVKYTPSGGNIRLTAESADQSVLFSVTDTGPGIPPRSATASSTNTAASSASARPRGSGSGWPSAAWR